EHFFLYLGKGKIEGYDGHKKYSLKAGEYCIVRKNRLARYNKQKDNGQFEKVVVVFDAPFLKAYMDRHNIVPPKPAPSPAFIMLKKDNLVPHFIRSLMPYYNGKSRIDDAFSNIK